MPVTSLPRAVPALAAAGALAIALAGVSPATAAAQNGDCACGGARVPAPSSRLFAPGTDVAAPDQQNPIPAPARPVPQAAPTWPRYPATLTPARRAAIAKNTDFQWEDAALGVGGTFGILLVATGGAVLLRRRRAIDPPLHA